ncbi:MAG: ComEA family DNA-binding protein [Carboxydocellales bacterium]
MERKNCTVEGLNGDWKKKLAVAVIGLALVTGIVNQIGIKLGFWGQLTTEGVTIVDGNKPQNQGKLQGQSQSQGLGQDQGKGQNQGLNQGQNQNSGTEQALVVHIVGAVEKPGVYFLPKGSRVNQVLEKAVARNDAALSYINLAQPLQDGEQVVVPSKKEVSDSTAGRINGNSGGGAISLRLAGNSPNSPVSPKQAAGTIIDINTANLGQLDTLPGIGPALAQRIIEFRDTNGPFKSIQDLQKVPGIGAKKFEQLANSVVIR